MKHALTVCGDTTFLVRRGERRYPDWVRVPVSPALWYEQNTGWVECERPAPHGQCRTVFYSEDLKDKLRDA